MVPEDHDAPAERLFGRRDPGVHLVVREAQISVGQRLALADALFLDLGQELDIQSAFSVNARPEGRAC